MARRVRRDLVLAGLEVDGGLCRGRSRTAEVEGGQSARSRMIEHRMGGSFEEGGDSEGGEELVQ